jgi:hypothetical protein
LKDSEELLKGLKDYEGFLKGSKRFLKDFEMFLEGLKYSEGF